MSSKPAVLAEQLPAPLKRDQQQLFTQIEQTHDALRNTPRTDSAANNRLRAELAALHSQRDALRARLRRLAPGVASLQHPRIPALSELQANLDGLVLSYIVTDSQLVAFAITAQPSEFSAKQIAIERSELANLAGRMRALAISGSPENQAAFRQISQELSSHLLSPFAGLLQKYEQITWIADDALLGLPIAALTSPKSASRYLLEDYRLVSVASATELLALHQGRQPNATQTQTLLAYADPTSSMQTINESDPTVTQWPALPHSRGEIETIAGLFSPGATTKIGPAATEASVKALASEATVLHLATHALVDHQSPLDSYLVLAKKDDDNPEDGLLRAWEVMEQMQLKTDLVTLSACDSALGEFISGEGTLGLLRAFQFAGANSVLASLWPVADRSTADLMASFYRHWTGGQGKAEALRSAQLELLQQPQPTPLETLWHWLGQRLGFDAPASHRLPLHWAGFQLYGNGG